MFAHDVDLKFCSGIEDGSDDESLKRSYRAQTFSCANNAHEPLIDNDKRVEYCMQVVE